MLKKSWFVAAVAAAVVCAAPAVASAETLGSVTLPLGQQATIPCALGQSSFAFAQVASSPAPFIVPGEGQITQWETNQTGNSAPAGEQLAFSVLRLTGGNYKVVGTDAETLPATLPQDGIVTFQIANPIKVAAGDVLALSAPNAAASPLCLFDFPALSADTALEFGPLSGVPEPGQMLPLLTLAGAPDALLDLAATFVPNQDDAGVTTTTGPSNAIAGEPALLSSTVTNGNVDNMPVTFIDAVPAGLTIDSAVAGSGACSTAGQIVSCTVGGLAPGQSAPVQIVVTPTAAGTYQNAVSISVPSSVTDPNPANNAASASLAVASAPSAASAIAATVATPVAHCMVPVLNRIPAPFARRVLGLLGCRVGSVRRVHSKTVAKGEVILSTPGAGTYSAAKVVSLTVSAGRAKGHR
jgi:hypothetical protein